MDAIKAAVTQTLEKQGIISQLKAQLRSQVFVAIDEYESGSSGTSGLASKTSVPARTALLADADGPVVVQLVLDLLDTCNFAFTKQVFQPELGPNAPTSTRQAAASRLGLKPSGVDEPLLLTLVKAYKSGGGAPVAPGDGGRSSTTTTTATSSSTVAAAAPAPAPAAASPPAPARSALPAAPLPRLEPLAPLSKSSLAPLAPLAAASSKPAAAEPASKPAAAAAEPSAEESNAYSDEGFEEEPVEEEVEEEALEEEPASIAQDDDDDDDDYASALGFKAAGSKGAADGGRDRPGAGSKGRTALDSDLMAGDRSFGVSNELAGLDAGNSGGLSFSADYGGGGLGGGGGGGGGGRDDAGRASLSTSHAGGMLSPISEGTPKSAKLEPLKPLGGPKLGPLAPLAPLPTIGTLSSSLSSSKDDPLAKGPKALAPLGGPIVRKSMADIEKEKEELRRLGLLSGDSLGNSMDAAESRPRPTSGGPFTNIYDAEVSVSASMDEAGAWGASGGGAGSGGGYGDRSLPFGSKGLSMDLRDTGLSASDRSGDIEQMGADLAETAEWH